MTVTPTTLPPELERIIFEYTAKKSRRDIPRLMLVAHRISIWLKPILYETIIRPNHQNKLVDYNPPTETLPTYALHVRHLLISVSTEAPEVTQYLTSCKNIENLALWSIVHHPNLLRLISPLHLKRLSINLSALAGRTHPFEYILPALTHLTHLEIVNQQFGWENIEGIQDIPNLTHLAFNGLKPLSILEDRILDGEGCEALEVVVLLEMTVGDLKGLRKEDGRVVCVGGGNWVDDWEKGTLGEEDFWTRAEFVVMARKRERERRGLGGGVLF
ncbi:hypothetical protein BDN72DRAFT_904252 [Pluteus cervinus]|uniref:Uncharacterized protein n=1 Tax=Pluteus cervinus TaxID=181527 RepID=A0ACD3A6Q8_9AGAR|nr:hypothetical protein BDN72DRAFT_904252 [Pluteus cervinus]